MELYRRNPSWDDSLDQHSSQPFHERIPHQSRQYQGLRLRLIFSSQSWNDFNKPNRYSLKIFLSICVAATAFSSSAQDFVNLTFDSPDLSGSLRPYEPSNPVTPFIGETSRLLRGWILLENGISTGEIAYQPAAGYRLEPVTLYSPFAGADTNYRLVIISSYPHQVDLRFQQTGRIPVDTISLGYFANGPMEMLINGKLLHTVDTTLGTMPIVDVSAYAGQVVNLEFHVFQKPFLGAQFEFDINGFTQVPEPSTWALFGVGAVGLAWFTRFCRPSPFL